MGATQIYGLIGYPVKHSFSAAMHNAAFEELDINARYVLLEIKPEELNDFLVNKLFKDTTIKDINGRAVPTGHIMGFNVTMPHKLRAKEILQKQWPVSSSDYFQSPAGYFIDVSGAVNTVTRAEKGLRYDNTDVVGFLKSLEEDLRYDSTNKKIFLIGCGGAGRAIIAGLSALPTRKAGAGFEVKQVSKIYIYDNNPDAAGAAMQYFSSFKTLTGKLEFVFVNKIPETIAQCDLLINASPIGMENDSGSIIRKEWLHKNLNVYDVVYNRETKLVNDARSSGLLCCGGLGMLLYQGVESFQIWTGQTAPVAIMREALKKALEETKPH